MIFMSLREIKLLKQAWKDGLLVTDKNRDSVAKLVQAEYIRRISIHETKDHKLHDVMAITKSGKEYLDDLREKQKESRRFWINAIVSIISGAIGFILGKFTC